MKARIARARTAPRRGGAWLAAPMAALCAGCVSTRVPDPRLAARAYATAAARGDSDALYAMLTDASKRARSKTELAQMVADERGELAEQAKALQDPGVRVEASARLRFADGEEAALELHGGRYSISAAGTLPGGARTPEQALDELRRVLARRSYVGLMRVLSLPARSAIENDLRALVDGLDKPGTLPVHIDGDTATVAVPGGHRVKLRRDDGLWRVEDFD